MLQTIARIKPFSLGKIYALICATATLLIGLVINAITVFWGQRAMSVSWQSVNFDGQMMLHTLTVKPVEILLLTCILTVIIFVIGFIYGIILALIYNFSAGIGGGLQLEMQGDIARASSVAATQQKEEKVSTTSSAPVQKKKAVKKVSKKK
jgi:hypothetical protein